MTPQEKCLLIIKEFELSARQVANAIGIKQSTASSKIKNENYNKFSDEDFSKLKSHYVQKFKNITALD